MNKRLLKIKFTILLANYQIFNKLRILNMILNNSIKNSKIRKLNRKLKTPKF